MRTRVGYAGGKKDTPTYRSLGDHTEAIEIDFDPSETSYAALLEIFFDGHDAGARSYSRQYASMIFYRGEAQKAAAEAAIARRREAGRAVATEVRPFERFWRAEDYHQKYALRASGELYRLVRAGLPSEEAFADSTLAARINGYVSGYGDPAALRPDLERLGVAPESIERFERGCGAKR